VYVFVVVENRGEEACWWLLKSWLDIIQQFCSVYPYKRTVFYAFNI